MMTAKPTKAANGPASLIAAATNAIFAGIAASDAACCAKLGKYSRSQNHRDASKFLASIEPGGRSAAKDFELLISKKDEANYGFNVSSTELKTLLRKAEGLVLFAQKSINF